MVVVVDATDEEAAPEARATVAPLSPEVATDFAAVVVVAIGKGGGMCAWATAAPTIIEPAPCLDFGPAVRRSSTSAWIDIRYKIYQLLI